MKKIILSASALLIASSLFFTACKKDENTAPEITLNGDASVVASLQGTYTDAGATAEDAEDGTLTVTSDASSTNPNMAQAGTYTITYSATDADGETSTATRTVVVQNDAYYLAGTYGCTETPGSTAWSQSISVSSTVNNEITFSKFASYQGNSSIKARVVTVGSDKYVRLTPSTQTASAIGANACNHTFTASATDGAKITLVSGKYAFSIKFSDEQTGGGAGCTPTAAVPYEDAFIQQ